MKLLLTSAGLTNASIVTALSALLPKPMEEVHLTIVPTAANAEEGDKRWVVNDLSRFCELSCEVVDIVDIAAVGEEVWLPRFREADVLVFGGGNTFYLNDCLRESGVSEHLSELLRTRVYVGISAGSAVASREVLAAASKELFPKEGSQRSERNTTGLGLIDFQIIPHLNAPYFPEVTKERSIKVAEAFDTQTYIIDDQTALQVVDGAVQVVGEGEYLEVSRT